MKGFVQFCTERFVNLVDLNPHSNQDNDDAAREKYAPIVFELLQKAYEPIGGIHGNGFKSPQDMLDKIPFWKLAREDGKIVAAVLYKDKTGRKAVAAATDGSRVGKESLVNMKINDLVPIKGSGSSRAYAEVSSKLLSVIVKEIGMDEVLKRAMVPAQAQRVMSDDKLHYPVPDDDEEVMRHPQLKNFFFQREIGGTMHTKVVIGSSGKNIHTR